MKKPISFILTVLTLLSMVSVSFVPTEVVAADRLPFSSTVATSVKISGFADESKTYYKISTGDSTTVKKLAKNGNYPYITQGATSINGDFYISATFKSALNYEEGYIFRYDTEDSKCYVSDLLPIGHANDLCYNPDKHWILVSNNVPDGTLITVINPDDLTFIKHISLKHIYGDTNVGCYGIEYNTRTKQYIICSSGTDTMNYLLDENFNVVHSYQREDPNLDKSISPYYLKQGLCATPDYLLNVYAGGPIGSYVNKIIVTDWYGNHIQTIQDTRKIEIEDAFFDNDGYLYFIYHADSAGSYLYNAKATAWTIKYLPNGGTGTMADSEHYYGTSKATSKNTFKRSGYNFAGWKISRKSDGKALYTNDNMESNTWYIPGQQPAGYRRSIYESGRSVSALAHDLFDEVYFEAQWVPVSTGTKSFYIDFDGNGGEGEMEMFKCIWGESNTLPKNTFVREDYKFIGWSARRRSTDYWGFVKVSDGTDYWGKWTTSSSYTLKIYQPETSVSKTSNVDTDVVEFMCQWEYIPNSIFVFDANGGSGAMENQKLVFGTPANIRENTFSKDGYRFAGWIAQKQSDGTYYLSDGSWSSSGTPYVFKDSESVTDIGEGTGDKINLIAQWKEVPEYTVTFNANDGTGAMSNVIMNVGTEYILPANKFTKTGYTFVGWSYNGTTYADGASVKDLGSAESTVTLTAQWTPNNYIITFNANSGEGEMEDLAMTYDVAKNLTANTFAKTGYTFAGWTFNGQTYKDEAEVTNLATSGTVTLTAQWTPITYTIRFNSNGGEGEMTEMTVAYDEAVTLTSNTFTKSNSLFLQWTMADGTVVENGAEIFNLTATDREVIELTAQWVLIGDVDSNGQINIRDFSRIQKYSAGLTKLTEVQLIAADVDGNGQVNIRDASYIQRYVAGILATFPIFK